MANEEINCMHVSVHVVSYVTSTLGGGGGYTWQGSHTHTHIYNKRNVFGYTLRI